VTPFVTFRSNNAGAHAPGRQDNIVMASSKLPGTEHSQQPHHRAIAMGAAVCFVQFV